MSKPKKQSDPLSEEFSSTGANESKVRNKQAVTKLGVNKEQKEFLYQQLIIQYKFDTREGGADESKLNDMKRTFSDILSPDLTWR